jgi:hypothetical protein
MDFIDFGCGRFMRYWLWLNVSFAGGGLCSCSRLFKPFHCDVDVDRDAEVSLPVALEVHPSMMSPG